MSMLSIYTLLIKKSLTYCRRAKKLISIENNYTSQYTKLLRMETGFEVQNKIVKYDGEPFTPLYLLKEVKRYL